MPGQFMGELHFQLMPDKTFRLTEAFGYRDPQGVEWPVPKHMQTNGASIPRSLWALVGDPFQGDYLPAAVIHDWYCDKRIRPYDKVDRMFFDAMITGGVPPFKAKLMYLAVLYAGPKWDGQAIVNAGLDLPQPTANPGPAPPLGQNGFGVAIPKASVFGDIGDGDDIARSRPWGDGYEVTTSIKPDLHKAPPIGPEDVERFKQLIAAEDPSPERIAQVAHSERARALG